jgi:enterochelin esterase-like enzyme
MPVGWSEEATRRLSADTRTWSVDSAMLRRLFPNLDAKANSDVRLLLIACGSSDELLGVNRSFKEWLKSSGVRFVDVETPGAHTFAVWRRNLVDLVQRLFQ